MAYSCPFCHVTSWQKCRKCGACQCNSCGKDKSGKKREAGNRCNGCGYVGEFDYGGSNIAPSWAV